MNKNNSISRKDAIKSLGALALGLPAVTSGIAGADRTKSPDAAETPGRNRSKGQLPNILFIIDDQHRGDFLGAAGAGWLATPNLDALAREGARFSKAYTSTPSCTPARTAILTGKSPWNHGMLGYMNNISQYYPNTMPQFFSERGFHTIVTGKNHFGPPRNSHGFLTARLEEGWYSVEKDGFRCDYQSWFHRHHPELDINATGLSYTDHRGGRAFPFADELHATHWTADQAIDFLKKSTGDAPWFLKLSFQRPHPPFDPPKRWMDHYKNMPVPMPAAGEWARKKYGDKTGRMEKTPEASSGIYPEADIRASREAYAGSISFVDEQIGRVLSELKKTGQYENTFILFTSDHGDMMGDQYMWRKCRPYEPSANVPMILRWPESIGLDSHRGQVRDELVEMRDIFPTLADACQLSPPDDLDGKSMLPLLRGDKTWRKMLDLEHNQTYEPDNAWAALTDGRYKYIYFTLTGEEQLFDLQTDPTEKENILERSSSRALHEEWYRKMVEHLSIRGERWVKDGKLQVQQTSLLVGDNFPPYKFDGHY